MDHPETLPQLFFAAVERFGTKRAALRYKGGDEWRDITHQDLARRVQQVALGIRELGIRPGDRIAILSDNRPEWAVADYACLSIGCIDVAVYPTLPANQIAYLLRDSGSVAIFVSNHEMYQRVAEIAEDAPELRHIISFDDLGPDVAALSMAALARHGAAAESKYPTYREDALAITPDTLATLIYTSGTTGPPKGVMLTHGNFTSNVLAALQVLSLGSDDSCLSLLPLSHSFERTAGHYVMLHAGATINYAESIDAVAANMLEVRPTVMLSVPRLYEKIHSRVLDAAVTGGSIKKRIFYWARRVGERWADLALAGQPVPAPLALQRRVADSLVFKKLRARTGGRLRYFVSGGAPLAPEISKFFAAAGLRILEGYGLTETSPVITVNPYERLKIGTVGPALPGVEVHIAQDGEILARGPNIMRGYYNKPDATAEAIDAEGWFHTGDIGELDDDGYLRITDRKKDLIVTAGGKKIAPQPIENRVKTSEFVQNAVMVGDKRKFAVMLVVPNRHTLEQWAKNRNMEVGSADQLLKLPDVSAKLEREVMVHLRDLARFEMPKKVLIVEEDFTQERGELTPTLKVKRRVVEEHYRDLIEGAYRDEAAADEAGEPAQG